MRIISYRPCRVTQGESEEDMTNEEKLLCERYQSDFEKEEGYYDGRNISLEGYATICRMKDRTNAMLDRRLQAAKEVIDLIAERVGINPQDTGFFLYVPDYDDSSPLLRKIDEYFSRGVDKVKMKKHIDELENENQVLRKLIGK